MYFELKYNTEFKKQQFRLILSTGNQLDHEKWMLHNRAILLLVNIILRPK